MKIVSWNINSLSSLITPQQSLAIPLSADIICFQEVKSTREKTLQSVALTPGYESYYSFSRTRDSYSGVATYVGNEYRPVDAEEGFSGLLCKYNGHKSKIGHYGKLFDEFTTQQLLELDSEGRVLITDHRLFVLFNVYFPCMNTSSSEGRNGFKERFSQAVQMRVDALIAAGRHVIVLGDLNVCHKEIDHCDYVRSNKERGISDFHNVPIRQWFDNWVSPNGKLVDMFRKQNPGKEGCYTCWNTYIDARKTNYGTRIDYILVSEGLESRVESASLHQDVFGSDHCPISLTLHDDRHEEVEDGMLMKINLKDEMYYDDDSPSLCTKNWPEFIGKQSNLKTFFQPLQKPPLKKPKLVETTKSIIPKPSNYFDPTPYIPKSTTKEETKASWNAIFKSSSPVPLCYHGETSKQGLTKKGVNAGRGYYTCARSVGTGYHDNKGKKRKEDLNEFSCDFFKWMNPPKRFLKKNC